VVQEEGGEFDLAFLDPQGHGIQDLCGVIAHRSPSRSDSVAAFEM
jgi:hypothetical protein